MKKNEETTKVSAYQLQFLIETEARNSQAKNLKVSINNRKMIRVNSSDKKN